MSTYAFRDAGGDLVLNVPEFGKPVPAHAQTPGALMAVEAVRMTGRAKRTALADAEIVTDHGHPAVIPFDGEAVPRAARALVALAEAAGMRTNVVELADRCTVEGIDRARGVAFRAYWTRGRTAGGSWHERAYRYTLIDDTRPVGVNKLTLTGLKGKRAAGVGTTRLSIIASPLGIPCNITELERKVREHGR